MYKFFFFLVLTVNIFAQNGIITSYYGKGKIRYEMSYVNNVLEGTSYWYYENGNLLSEKTYDNGKLHGWQRNYFETGLLKDEIYFNNGLRDGLYKEYFENGGLKEVKNYEQGKLIKTIQISFDENYQAPIEAYKKGNRQIQKELKEERFICTIDICPVPIGGMQAIQDNVVYPEHAKLYGLEGIVVLIATINTEGNAVDFKVVSGIGLGCDEAAIDAVKKTRFIPGTDKGNVVKADVTIKVEFRLSEKSILSIAKKDEKEIKNELNNLIIVDNQINKSEEEKIKVAENVVATLNTNVPNNKNADETDTSITYIKSRVECEVTNCPIPVGGWGKIIEHLVIPKTVKRLKLSGDIIVLATVDEYGNVRDTKVLQKLGHGADEAVEVAILDTHFIPGELNGQKIRCDVKITVPIRENK
ncbi:MAG TPA: TonB family protein [Melioribacteraceae bacterium]|nr:TonB family protein [Melioribacteraceae bacterium]